MSKYLIHTGKKRKWYVDEYLYPSLLEQGIKEEDIIIHLDNKGVGTIQAYADSFEKIPDTGYTWHLQDDIIISPDFKQVTEAEENENRVVCGFTSYYDTNPRKGLVQSYEMWYSFPCIGIPNRVGKGCMEWIQKYMIGNPAYKDYWENGNCVDWFFKQYVRDEAKDIRVLNFVPNIVDHIDYLLGGSTIRKVPRKILARSIYWKYPELVKELEEKIKCHYGQQ